MFDQPAPASLSDKLSNAIYRWRGIDKWPEAEATVFSCEWVLGGRYNPGHYVVTYSYWANGEIQEGSYSEDGSETQSPYQKGDTFSIRWNPRNPAKSYTANNNGERNLIWIPIVAILISILIVLILFGSKPAVSTP